MRRALVALSLSSTACIFHFDMKHNSPGVGDVRKPPTADLVTHVRPDDPGENGLLFHLQPMVGPLFGEQAVSPTVGFEVGMTPFSLEKSHTTGTAIDAVLRTPRFRPSVGWWPWRGAASPVPERFGPIFAELQFGLFPAGDTVLGHLLFGIGAAVNPQNVGGGPQGTVCFGIHPAILMLCARGAYMAGGDGAELTIYFATNIYTEVVWSK